MIYTVNGAIEKDQMGITLSHEHFKWEFDDSYASMMYFDKCYDDKDIQNSYNTLLPVIKDLYKNSCRTIVEASPPVGGQNIKLLKKLSTDSGMNIIPSTGMNIFKQIHQIFKEQYAEQLAQRWIADFETGLDTLDGVMIRPGYIKLLLDEGELSDVDQDMLRAAVIASKKTGMPIHCHILESAMIYTVIDLLEIETADFSKFLWAHADKEGNFKAINHAISKGMWIGFDMIKDGTYDEKIKLIHEMIRLGHSDRIILSQDYDLYEEVSKKENDHPCSSFFTKFIPYCVANGIDQSLLETVLTSNPANFYNID